MDFTLSLTHNCNLACSYCYAGAKRAQAMTWEVARTAIDFALSAKSEEAQLGYFGGEPLLEWDLLKKSTGYAQKQAAKHGISLKKTVTTNATLLGRERLAWLAKHDFYPALSIDGNRAMHEKTRPLQGGASSFDQCMRGLDMTQEFFPEVEVILVPDPANVKHLAAGARFLVKDKGVKRISINPNFYTEWPQPALDSWRDAFHEMGDLYLQEHRNGSAFALNFLDAKVITRLKDGFECRDRCNFGEREIAIAPSGNIYPCERVIGDDNNAELCIGNIFDGFDEERRGAVLARRGNINAECITCAIRKRCMNWCCCINYALTGAIDRTDGIVCFHERLAVEVADQVGGRLYQEKNPAFLARFYYE